MKKTLLLLLLVSIAVGGVFAKGSNEKAPAAAETGGKTTPQGKVVVWVHHYDVEAAFLKDLTDKFMQANPGITVEFESIPYDTYWDKLNVALETGNGPDVFRVPVNVLGEYYTRGQIVPIPTDLYTNEALAAVFSPNITELLKMPDGKFYGLPSSVMPLVLIINDNLFRGAGLDPQKDAPKTWSDFRALAKRLTIRDEKGALKVAGVSIVGSPYQYYWTFPVQNSAMGVADVAARKPSIANEAGYAAWKFMTDLVTVDKVDDVEFKGDMRSGTAAMVLQEYIGLADLMATAPDYKFSVHLPPYPDGKKAGGAFTSWAFAVTKDSKAPAAAWKLLDFIDSEANQKDAALKAIDLPSRIKVLEDSQLRTDGNVAVALDALKSAKPYNGLGWDDIWYIEQAAFESIVLNGASVKSAVDEASGKLDALYAKKFK